MTSPSRPGMFPSSGKGHSSAPSSPSPSAVGSSSSQPSPSSFVDGCLSLSSSPSWSSPSRSSPSSLSPYPLLSPSPSPSIPVKRKPARRFYWTTKVELELLKQVRTHERPFRRASQAWESVADAIGITAGTRPTARSCQDHAVLLCKEHSKKSKEHSKKSKEHSKKSKEHSKKSNASKKKSGTEEDYTEMDQLLDDVLPMYEEREVEKEKSAAARKKGEVGRAAGLRMRENALLTLSKKWKADDEPMPDPVLCDNLTDEEGDLIPTSDTATSTSSSSSGKPKKRINVKELIKERTEQKKKELELREKELELQAKRQDAELEERRALIAFLKANTPK